MLTNLPGAEEHAGERGQPGDGRGHDGAVVELEADALALFDAANVTRLVNPDFDPLWLGSVVADKLTELLTSHAAVMFAEADELLYVHRRHEGNASAGHRQAGAAGLCTTSGMRDHAA